MIYFNTQQYKNLNNWNDDSIYVLTDFDRTLTTGTSQSSWGILSKDDFVTDEYEKEKNALYTYYRPFEIDESLSLEEKNKLMNDWWNQHIGLFIKYQLKEKVVIQAANNIHVMQFRKGALELLKNFYQRQIPVIIISAGIGNFIMQFLIYNHCYYDNIVIISNFIQFKNGYAVGIDGKVIHSVNKNEAVLPDYVKEKLIGRNHAILMGDQVADVYMLEKEHRENALKIGFLEEKEDINKMYYDQVYDVLCTDNTGFDSLDQSIKLIKKNR